MAVNNEAQQILEELKRARAESQLWATPQPQPTQTPEQMTGGLAAMPTMNSTFMAMAQQQSLASQQLQAYAMGIPGSQSPIYTTPNPMMANYQLQNMYMMNPYMANYFGSQQGGAPQMNLAPAYYQTPSRMGVFRNIQTPDRPGMIGASGVIRDIATLGHFRAFAPYEDPIDSTIEASRRMTMRGESLTMGSLSTMALAASFIPGIGLPTALALDFAVAPALEAAGSSYFQRRAETSKLYDISRSIATVGNAHGFRGQGFSLGESADLMLSMRRGSAQSPFYNMSDYMSVMEEGTQAGLFAFSGSPDATKKRLKEVIGQIDILMRLAGDPDVKSAVERMSSLQSMGVGPGGMLSAMTNLKAFSMMAGTTVEGIMSGAGAMGAQMAVQQGGPAVFGMMMGGLTQGSVRGMVQRGLLSPLELSLKGGESGLTQGVTSAMVNSVQSWMGLNVASFTDFSGEKPHLDRKALNEYLETGVTPGGGRNLVQSTLSKVNSLGLQDRQALIRSQETLTGEALAGLSPLQMIQAERRQLEELRRIYPGGTKMQDILFQRYGEEWKAFDYLLSDQNISDVRGKEIEALRTRAATDRHKYEISQQVHHRAGVWMSTMWNDLIEGMFDFKGRAEKEQYKAQDAAQQLYIKGLDEIRGGNVEALHKKSGLRPGRVPINPNIATETYFDTSQFSRYMNDMSLAAKENKELAPAVFGANGIFESVGGYLKSIVGKNKTADDILLRGKGTPASYDVDSAEQAYKDLTLEVGGVFGVGSRKFLNAIEVDKLTPEQIAGLKKYANEKNDPAMKKLWDDFNYVSNQNNLRKTQDDVQNYQYQADLQRKAFGISSDENTSLLSLMGALTGSAKEGTYKSYSAVARDALGLLDGSEDALKKKLLGKGFSETDAARIAAEAWQTQLVLEKNKDDGKDTRKLLMSGGVDALTDLASYSHVTYAAAEKLKEVEGGRGISLFADQSDQEVWAELQAKQLLQLQEETGKTSFSKTFGGVDEEKKKAALQKLKGDYMKQATETSAVTSSALDSNMQLDPRQLERIQANNSSEMVVLLRELVRTQKAKV